MIVNQGNLQTLFTGFNTHFSTAFAGAKATHDKISMRVVSDMREETYAWFGQNPRMREWLGDRVVKQVSVNGYTITNKKFEETVEVSRDDIADDKYGVYAPFFAEMGRAAAFHPDELLYALLASGFDTACYDGQNFFDTDHPVRTADGDGPVESVSNFGGGSGTAWYLLDTSRMVRPFVFQVREDYAFATIASESDEHVFMTDKYLYGVRARVNAGFGLWQLAYASKAALDAESYGAARAAMMAIAGDGGRKLGIMPDTLVVPTSLERAARKVVVSGLSEAGATNEWAGTADLIVTPYL